MINVNIERFHGSDDLFDDHRSHTLNMPIGIGWIFAPKDIKGNCAGVTKEWRENAEYEVETTHPGKDGLAEIVRRPVKISIKAPFDPKSERMYGPPPSSQTLPNVTLDKKMTQ